jgi:putative membrane protein
MKYILIRTIAVLVASYVTKVGVPLMFSTFPYIVGTTWTAFLVAITLAITNHTIKPLFVLVSIPINLITFGLFSFVINGLMVLLAEKIVPGFDIPSLLMAIYFALVLSVVNWILHKFE